MPIISRGAILCTLAGLFVVGCDRLEDKSAKAEKQIAKLLEESQAKHHEAVTKQQESDWLLLQAESSAAQSNMQADKGAKGDEKANSEASVLKSKAQSAARDAQKLQASAKSLQDEADAKLAAATRENLATPTVLAWSQASNGQSYFDQALSRLRLIDALQIRTREVTWQLEMLAGKISDNYQAIATVALSDPSKAPAGGGKSPLEAAGAVQEDFKKAKAELDKKISDLQAQIDPNNAQIKAKSDEKALADQRTAEFSHKAEETKGDEAMANLKEALEAREKAHNLNVDVETTKAKTNELTHVQDGLKKQLDSINHSIEVVENQSKLIQATWAQLVQQQDLLKAETAALIGTPVDATTEPATPGAPTRVAGRPGLPGGDPLVTPSSSEPSVSIKSKQLADLYALMDQKRDEAIALLAKADAAFEKAAGTAERAVTEIKKQEDELRTKNPERLKTLADLGNDDLAKLKRLNSPAIYLLRRGRVTGTLVNIYAGRVRTLDAQLALIHVFQAIDEKLAVPDDLTKNKPEDAKKEAVDKVNEQLLNLDKDDKSGLTEAIRQGDDQVRGDATLIRAFAYYQKYTVTHDLKDLASAKDKYLATDVPTDVRLKLEAYIPDDLRTGNALHPTEMDPAAMRASATSMPAAPARPAGAAGGPTVFEDDPEAMAARDIASKFGEAVMAGNGDTAKTFLGANIPPDQLQMIDAYSTMMQSMNKFKTVVVAKFPDIKALDKPQSDVAGYVHSGKMTAAGEDATLGSANEAKPMRLKKVDGAWKIVDCGAALPIPFAGPNIIRAQAKAYEDTIPEVNADKFTSVEEVNKAVNDKVKTAMGY